MNHVESTSGRLLSLCMIVRNEQQNLPRCLASAQPHVDEIVVIDTGSKDNTTEIALQFGARVNYFEWCDDFAAARNYAVSQASSDWILAIDADEELVVESKNFRNQLITESDVFSLELIDANSESKLTEFRPIRLFRNQPELRYVNRFHEQLARQGQQINRSQASCLPGVKILHYGYGKEQLQKKIATRNIPILELMRHEGKIGLMPLICLADMYNSAQQVEKAQQCYTEAFDRLLPSLINDELPAETGFVPFLLHKVGWQLLEQEDYETVRLICQQGLKWFSRYPPLNYLAGLTLLVLGFPKGAVPYFERCLQLSREGSYDKREPFNQDFMTTHPAFSLGRAYEELKHWQQAVAAFNLTLSFDPDHSPAKERLESIQHHLSLHVV